MRNRKEEIRKLKCQSRGSHIQIMNSRKSKQNIKEGKMYQNSSRAFPRADSSLKVPSRMDENGLKQRPVIIKFQNTGNKEKFYILPERKTAMEVSNNSFPCTPSQEVRGGSAPPNRQWIQKGEDFGYRKQDLQHKREKPAVLQTLRASSLGWRVEILQGEESTEYLMCLTVRRRCKALGRVWDWNCNNTKQEKKKKKSKAITNPRENKKMIQGRRSDHHQSLLL